MYETLVTNVTTLSQKWYRISYSFSGYTIFFPPGSFSITNHYIFTNFEVTKYFRDEEGKPYLQALETKFEKLYDLAKNVHYMGLTFICWIYNSGTVKTKGSCRVTAIVQYDITVIIEMGGRGL